MLKTRILNTVFLTALSLTGFLLLYVYFFIHPAYHELLVEKAERDAVRYVNFLVHAYHLDHAPIRFGEIPKEVSQDVGQFTDDNELIKLRVFDAGGRIVYSTLPKEIGQINRHDYFLDTVAQGTVYSKTVRKDSLTAEMEFVKTDLVETYVPIMLNGQFQGAVETYYDVTRSSEQIRRLTSHSLVFLGIVALVLNLILYYALRKADFSIMARMRAENELRKINEDLEVRVAERAGELIRVNRNLNDEVIERKQAQASLGKALVEMEEARDKVDGIVRSVSDGILVIDQNDNIVLMNSPAERIIGHDLDGVSGRSIHDLDLPASLKSALPAILSEEGGKGGDFEMPSAVADRPQIFQARVSRLQDRNGAETGTIILMQDVSFERQIERMKNDFLAMAAHELRTPLASIMGYSELLSGETERQLNPEQKREFLAFIHQRAEGLSRIVDDLLDVSRIEFGQQVSIVKTRFDFCRMIERALSVYRKTTPGYEFLFEVDCQDCQLYADPVRIEQVVENLLSNAVKYSPDGGPISVSCREDDGLCCLVVNDRGIGMSDEQVRHIFDKFYRVDVSDTARQGIGLGMSIVKNIIDSHAGFINVESELGKGTRVTVCLPRGTGKDEQNG